MSNLGELERKLIKLGRFRDLQIQGLENANAAALKTRDTLKEILHTLENVPGLREEIRNNASPALKQRLRELVKTKGKDDDETPSASARADC